MIILNEKINFISDGMAKKIEWDKLLEAFNEIYTLKSDDKVLDISDKLCQYRESILLTDIKKLKVDKKLISKVQSEFKTYNWLIKDKELDKLININNNS